MVRGFLEVERAEDLIQVKEVMKKKQYRLIMQRHATISALRITGKKSFFNKTMTKKNFLSYFKITSNQKKKKKKENFKN